MSDVAALAGVSPITVSRALRGETTVDADLAQRVRAAASELKYTPDPAARALASRHSAHVAVLIPMLSNTLFVELLESVQKTLRAAGYQTLMGITHYDPDEEEQLLREQLMHRPAGLLVTGTDQSDNTRALMASSGVPCVHVMDFNPTESAYCVGFSQQAAGHAMTEHLLNQGRRRVAFVAAQLDPRTLQRAQGYRACLQQHGLYDPALEVLSPLPSSMALGGVLFEQLLSLQPDCDAVFFCNDDLAQGGLLSALRHQVAVPKRVAIAGFNNLPGSDQMLPPLSTVSTPRQAIGQASAEMLLTLMQGKTPPAKHIDLGFELLIRGST